MLEKIIEADKSLLLSLNSYYSEFWDHFFWIFTQMLTWLPAVIILLYVIIKTKKIESIWIILGIAVTILIADQISSGLLKPLVERWRPSRDPSIQSFVHIVNNYTGGKYGFVSSHAANSFGIALFTVLLFKNKLFTYSIFIWAAMNSYSRIYLGVHYPLDILGGTIVGLGAACFAFYLLKRLRPQALQTDASFINGQTATGFNLKDINITLTALYSTILLIAVFYLFYD